jgi:hypothetical protein
MIVCFLLTAFLASSSIAQENDYSLNIGDPEWRFDAYVYVWAFSINGDVGTSNEADTVNIRVSDIFDKTNWEWFVFFQARKDRWNIFTELGYTDISDNGYIQTGDPSIDPLATTFSMKLFTVDLAGAYAVGADNQWQFLLGGKYISVKPKVRVETVGNFDISQSWIEPYLGLRFLVNEGYFYGNLRADVGGFDVGSKLYWQFIAGIGYQFDENWSTNLMYRTMSFDYEDKDKGFVFDTQMSGIVIGLGLHF